VYVGNTATSTGAVELSIPDGAYYYTGRDIVWVGEILVCKTRLLSVSFPDGSSGSIPANLWMEWEEEGA
jgi:hypothetical protein